PERHGVVIDLRIAIRAQNATSLFAALRFVAMCLEVRLGVVDDLLSDSPSLSGAELGHSVLADVKKAGAGSTSPARALSGQEASAVGFFDERERPTVFEVAPPGALELGPGHAGLTMLVVKDVDGDAERKTFELSLELIEFGQRLRAQNDCKEDIEARVCRESLELRCQRMEGLLNITIRSRA